MSDLKTPGPVLFFFSVLYNETAVSLSEVRALTSSICPIDFSFHHDYYPMKDYYSKEMGDSLHLKRIFFLCSNAIDRFELVTFKKLSDQLEKSNSVNRKRNINIDVGFVALDQVVLATGKPYYHRIHLKDGVFANLELYFQDNEFKTFPWSYPDYSHPEIRDFFKWARMLLKNTISV